MDQCSVPVRRRGFTLIELLVVITILVLLLSIVMAALYPAITASHDTGREGQFTALQSAIATYKTSFSGELPGYFREDELPQLNAPGVSDHKTISGIQNLMISLMGGIVSDSVVNAKPYKITADEPLTLDLAQLGRGSDGYAPFYGANADELKYVKIEDSSDEDKMMPVLADAYTSTPLLYFRNSHTGTQPVAQGNSGGAFLWGANQRWYARGSIITDRGVYEQATRSLIGGEVAGADPLESLAWFVVNPQTSNLSGVGRANHPDNSLKGDYVLINAGEDGIYFDQDNLGGDPPKNRITGHEDIKKFDDIVRAGT